MSRIYTMRKTCPACSTRFTIAGSAAVYCQSKDCQLRRRRQDYKDRRDRTGPYARDARLDEGSAGHLARARESGK